MLNDSNRPSSIIIFRTRDIVRAIPFRCTFVYVGNRGRVREDVHVTDNNMMRRNK